MAWTPNSANAELQVGMTPTPVTGHANPFSHTLGDVADNADQGLQDTSTRWNDEAGTGYTPHSILAGLPGMSGNGMSAADQQRVLPGGSQLPQPDGTSADTYQQATLLNRMYGTD